MAVTLELRSMYCKHVGTDYIPLHSLFLPYENTWYSTEMLVSLQASVIDSPKENVLIK